MRFNIVRRHETRITQTPNAVMTTLASPTVSDSETSCWLVTMTANSAGPLHSMDSEQICHVLNGSVTCDIEGSITTLEEGDTIRIAGNVNRQFSAKDDVTMMVSGKPTALARTDNKCVVPPWIS